MRPRRPFIVSAVVVTASLGAVGFLPLFGGPGYEHALATGILVPSAAAIATAIEVSRRDDLTPLGSLGRGLVLGLGLAAISLATALVHAARVGICELWGALLYFALTAGIGCLLGGAWGAVVGETVAAATRRGRLLRSRRRTVLTVFLALAAPVGTIAVGVGRFYASPMIFAFDPFVGYFSGTLYDTVIDAGTALLTYRLGSFATLASLALVASVLERHSDRRFGLALDLRTVRSRVRAGLGFAAALASAGMVLAGTKLGHFSTTASIISDLGASKHGARCDVIYPATTREQEANLLVKDCDEEVVAVEKRLGTKGPPRVRAFFFRDAEDKKRLMGAAHTYIAKPWREEVYLQLGGYPHPVLGHELAHVIAGSFARGSFRIAGDVGGLVPNPGLIEGIAVAASPEDDDLTGAQWARAMLQLEILPPIGRVFSFGFLGDASAKSYTLAGAFVDWVASRFGMDVVRGWYGGGDINALTGKDWSALDREFREHLKTVPLPAEAESYARARFARPGMFGRRCPHVVDALRHEADVCRDSQRFEDAMRLYKEVLSKDAADFASRQSLAVTERRHGDRARGAAELESLVAGENVPRSWKDRADEAIADSDLLDGAYDAAAARYARLAARSLDEDSARTLEVKALGARDPEARSSVQALLLGDAKHGPDVFVAGAALGGWIANKPSPLASYLLGRNFLQRGFYELGATALDDALGAPLPTPRIAREAVRQRAIAACALGDQTSLGRMRARIGADAALFTGSSGGRRDAMLRLIDRCMR